MVFVVPTGAAADSSARVGFCYMNISCFGYLIYVQCMDLYIFCLWDGICAVFVYYWGVFHLSSARAGRCNVVKSGQQLINTILILSVTVIVKSFFLFRVCF